MGQIGPEQLELFALELGKIAAFVFVYFLASTNINQSTPNLVTMYMSIRSQMSLIMGQVIPDQSVLSALEIEKLNFNSLLVIYPHCQPVLLCTQVSDIGPLWSSCLRICSCSYSEFRRISLCLYSTMFLDRSKFRKVFEKGYSREDFYEIISKSDE